MNNYTFNDHIHNYAVWTAARAVQRGFQGATTENISNAIDKAGLRTKFLDSNTEWTDKKFEKVHEETVKILRLNLNNCSFGRAAKIIAIYIKTAVLLPNKGDNSLSKVAFPPIDNILLSNLKNQRIIDKYDKWTTIEESEKFFKIITEIKKHLNGKPFWEIERFWQPNKNVKE